MGRSVPWDVLRVGRFKSWTFSDGTFQELELSYVQRKIIITH